MPAPASSFNWQPTLGNDWVLLRPLTTDDFEPLRLAASDPLIWEQHPGKDRAELPGFTRFFGEAMASGGAFAIVDRQTNEVIGTTRFTPSAECPDAVEIGWTFFTRLYWRKGYNSWVKKMMLDYAFERVRYVLFYVDEHNFRSQEAVERLGAQRITELSGRVLAVRKNANFTYCLTAETRLL